MKICWDSLPQSRCGCSLEKLFPQHVCSRWDAYLSDLGLTLCSQNCVGILHYLLQKMRNQACFSISVSEQHRRSKGKLSELRIQSETLVLFSELFIPSFVSGSSFL